MWKKKKKNVKKEKEEKVQTSIQRLEVKCWHLFAMWERKKGEKENSEPVNFRLGVRPPSFIAAFFVIFTNSCVKYLARADQSLTLSIS